MASFNFSWQRPAGEEGQDLTYQLHENGVIVVEKILEPTFSLIMDGRPSGDYAYQVSAHRVSDGQTSPPSEAVVQNFIRPLAAPAGLIVSYES